MKPELLAPAGQWEALIAAVQNGADAVYLGGKTLNARRGASNFDGDELIKAADYLHERGKKLYVTVNTLLKQNEFSDLEKTARELAACHADAAIVQDLGVCEALSQMVPGLRLHASTQMAVCNAQGAEYLKTRGFERVVLAREMDLDEIRLCADAGIETEVFCHGALCVACSGQCLFSSMIGGRSGNRGMCAQPCRMEYALHGAMNVSGYLLSPRDLMSAGYLNKLCDANVSSLKIEGRLKRPEYVAVVTGIYRKLLDGEPFTAKDEKALKQIFNRGGFTRGYAEGICDGDFISASRPSHWGIKAGSSLDGRTVRLTETVAADDALALRVPGGEEIPLRLEGESGQTLKNPAGKAGEVYLMSSAAQLSAARASYAKEKPFVALSARLYAQIGQKLRLSLSDGPREAETTGAVVEKASSKPFDEKRIREQLQKTGGTCYAVEDVLIKADKDAFVAVSEINKLRREALEAIGKQRAHDFAGASGETRAYTLPLFETNRRAVPRITVQSANAALLRRCLEAGADDAVFYPSDLRPEALKSADIDGMFLHLPPVCHTRDLQRLSEFARDNERKLKGVYITNIGQLGCQWPGERRFGFEMNMTNSAALHFPGITDSIYTPSLELTASEITLMGGARELIVYGSVPLMHLRHCPLNAARKGGAHAACRACDGARQGQRLNDCALRDRTNADFPLRRTASEEGCVIDLLNSVPMDLSGRIAQLPACVSWRLLFSDETEEEALRITRRYLRLARSRQSEPPEEKFTTGHYFRAVE